MSGHGDSPYTSRTPDEGRVLTMMSVPIPARASGAVLMRGPGMPTAVCVGSADLSADEWLRIVNRRIRGAGYEEVQPIAMGMLRLDVALERHGGVYSRSTYNVDCATFASGTADPSTPVPSIGDIPMTRADVGPTCCWLVTDTSGPQLLVYPCAPRGPTDSVELAQDISAVMCGEFSIERLDTGVIRTADQMHVPGWALALEPRDADVVPGMR
jgi:hypothetical protein